MIVWRGTVQLYNTKEDIAETTRLTETHPEMAESLHAQWLEMDRTLTMPEAWQSVLRQEWTHNQYQQGDNESRKRKSHYEAESELPPSSRAPRDPGAGRWKSEGLGVTASETGRALLRLPPELHRHSRIER